MKISIAIPVLNDVRVGRALDSVLSQQHEHELEVIVVDAGSTDGTLEVVERYRGRIAVLVSEPDRGIYDGMNKGIGLATGDVVGILNADDRYSDPLVLRDVMDAFSSEDIDACYGDLVYTNEAGKMVRYWKAGGPREVAPRLDAPSSHVLREEARLRALRRVRSALSYLRRLRADAAADAQARDRGQVPGPGAGEHGAGRQFRRVPIDDCEGEPRGGSGVAEERPAWRNAGARAEACEEVATDGDPAY